MIYIVIVQGLSNTYVSSLIVVSVNCMFLCVWTGVGQKIQQYYSTFVNNANIKTVFNLAAEHTFVSYASNYYCYLYSTDDGSPNAYMHSECTV